MLGKHHKSKLYWSILVVWFLTLVFGLLSTCNAAVEVDLYVNGKDYAARVNNDGSVTNQTDNSTILNGAAVRYQFDVTEYYPWLGAAYPYIQYSDVDDSYCKVDNTDLPKWYQLKNGNIDSPSWSSVGTLDKVASKSWVSYESWYTTYIRSTDGRYYYDIMVRAPQCSVTDDADIRIYQLRINLRLTYSVNTAQIDGSPKVVDYGQIDLGVANSRNVTIKNIGDGSSSKNWGISSPSWIKSKSGTVSANSNSTASLEIDAAQLSSTNIRQLEGTLVPVNNTGLSPSTPGLKGDFYHLPGGSPGNLSDAENSTHKHLAYSGLFSSIDFYDSGGTNGAFDDYEEFKSGSTNTKLRKNFLAIFTGFIKVNTTGTYTFYVTHDDGVRLKIDGTNVVNRQDWSSTAHEGTKDLTAGVYYPIELVYFQGGGGKVLRLEWASASAGVSREVVGSNVLSNGLNILVKASPKKPTVQFTTTTGKGSKVNVTKNIRSTFAVTASPGSTGVGIADNKYQWKMEPSTTESTYRDGTAQKDYTFDNVGVYTVSCRSVDAKGVESLPASISVRSFNPPTVNDKPLQAAFPPPAPTASNSTVSWYNGTYVGVINQPVYLKAEGTLGSGNGVTDEAFNKFKWELDDNTSNGYEREQTPGQRVSYTWTQPRGGQIGCKAVTNYTIESVEMKFNLKIYSQVQVNADGPYTGRPGRDVELVGTINSASYVGAGFVYQWYVKTADNNTFTAIATGADGKAKFSWLVEGEYEVKFDATVTTSEGLQIAGSATALVHVEAGMPTSMPDGPYRGGIAGGNFSPVEAQGNPPDFIEAEDIGKIIDWRWVFDPGLDTNSGGQFKTLLSENVDFMISQLNSGTATNEKVSGNVNSGKEALKITGQGRSRTSVAGWNYSIVEVPKGASEFRYITFAWRKDGGTGIGIQLYGYNYSTGTWDWNHRYHAGSNVFTWFSPSKQVSTNIPSEWEIVTCDLFADYGNFTVRGIAFNPLNGTAAYFDDVYLHKSPLPPLGYSRGSQKATHAYSKEGTYQASLSVKSEFGKWGLVDTTEIKIIDGEISGYVRAADLRTPVKNATLTLTSSHVDIDALSAIAESDPSLMTNSDRSGITTTANDKGYYSFKNIPLGSYRIIASKVDGTTIHEFQNNGVMVTELTMDAPNQIAIDFVDLSVFPISGRIVYSIQKNKVDVLVDGVEVEAQALGNTNSLKSLPSKKSDSGTGNYSLPLFSGQYLFIASRQGHDIRIKTDTPNYDSNTDLVTIDRARTDINFVDYTTRKLTVFVVDSGGNKVSGKEITISGTNGEANGVSDVSDGKLDVTLPPDVYTVMVKGAKPETKEVDLNAGDQEVSMVIPVKIVLSITPKPKLLDVPDEFLELFSLTPDQNPENYMYYYAPEPRTHIYTITATANGYPVNDFKLFVYDEISMMTDTPPEEASFDVQGSQGTYTITAGYPKMDRTADPPLAAPKWITFMAEKEGYYDSDLVKEGVTVLGDVPVGSAMNIVSVPVVNYMVLHDPPGDGSYSYVDDSMTLKGVVSGMSMTIGNEKVPVYPSPWRNERQVAGFTFDKDPGSDTTSKDLAGKGLIGSDRTVIPSAGVFAMAAAAEGLSGIALFLAGPLAFVVQLVKIPILAVSLEAGTAISGATGVVQYEVSPGRHLETPSGDSLTDLVGPGKGDIYYGEGWTLGLQQRYRLGIRLNSSNQWVLETNPIMTYDVLERTNQYVYTIKDIVNLVNNLDAAIAAATDEDEKTNLQNAQNTWESLLDKNLAYVWQRDYVSQGKTFEEFKSDHPELSDEETENLIFSAGPKFQYSRKISEGMYTKCNYEIGVKSTGGMESGLKNSLGFEMFGTGTKMEINLKGDAGVESGTGYGAEWESGKGAEQTVGFALNDDDIGDNISTRIYPDPIWGTPIFFQDAGSITSDPWEAGTQKAVDLSLELLEQPTGTVDYRDGAHYKVKIQYTGQRELETNWTDFVIYSLWTDNSDNLTAKFNGQVGPYEFSLAKGEDSAATTFVISLYPPEKDWNNSEEKEYSMVVEVDEVADSYQINRVITLKPKFADLRAPRATIAAPYDGERVSPVFFPTTDPFKIEVVSEDKDLAKIQLQIRSKKPNSIWEPWRNLTGMLWEDGKPNANVELFERLDQVPPRYEFTFKWTDAEISILGVGEYAIRAVATDKATNPNTDVDPPAVIFLVDDSKPTVLTSIPDYQAREKDRIYRGELSVLFTDDMRAGDFSDRTFFVTDLLKGGEKVAGFVSYSPALRKAIFVPIVPFNPNGFYRAEIKTDSEKDGVIEQGVHDLAGNPLDNSFMWTFRTTDAPFEPTWSIELSTSDGTNADGNNIAAVEYGALDDDDEKDARSVPALTSHLSLSFLDRAMTEYDRDIRPADGRLSHHWFFVISDAINGSTVTINWRPSLKLTKTDRQYQYIQLVEFNADGSVKQTILLDPTLSTLDPVTGKMQELVAYTYTTAQNETSRYFRLDVMKSNFVATDFVSGTSGWKFFSVPITPQRDDPFVNLGDDIDPLQLYRYDTQTNGYKIYPLDLGEVSVQTGRGYFTRLTSNIEVDVGGVSNLSDMKYSLSSVGWYAIGNPFVMPVNIADLKFNDKTFNEAVTDGLIEGTLYRWKIDNVNPDAYNPATNANSLEPWEGYWLKTKQANITITIPAPAGIGGAISALPASFNPPMPSLAPPLQHKPVAKSQLELRLELTGCDSAGNPFSSDVTTVFGTCENAVNEWDALDQSEPPTLSQTVAAYFDHSDWGSDAGLYNSDYQPMMKDGEERIWTFTVYTNKPNAKMTLSWENTISQVLGNVMLYFRGIDNATKDSEWQDMREVRSVEIVSRSQVTKALFEIRAVYFEMTPPSDVQVIAGEKQVTLHWVPSNNAFVSGYTIIRQEGTIESWRDDEGVRYFVQQNSAPSLQFIDTNVDEERIYTYQISTQFKTGVELLSELFTIRIKPVIKQTVLMQNYPNPFNPEVWIPYELSEQTEVSIQIYNASGQLVRILDLGMKDRGRYTSMDKAAYWAGLNEAGEKASSGVYFYVLKAGKFTATRKMVLLK